MNSNHAERSRIPIAPQSSLMQYAGRLTLLIVLGNVAIVGLTGLLFYVLTYPEFGRAVARFLGAEQPAHFFALFWRISEAGFFCAAVPFFIYAFRGHFRFALLETLGLVLFTGGLMGLTFCDNSSTLNTLLRLVGCPVVVGATFAIIARQQQIRTWRVWPLVGAVLGLLLTPDSPVAPVLVCGASVCAVLLAHTLRIKAGGAAVAARV